MRHDHRQKIIKQKWKSVKQDLSNVSYTTLTAEHRGRVGYSPTNNFACKLLHVNPATAATSKDDPAEI